MKRLAVVGAIVVLLAAAWSGTAAADLGGTVSTPSGFVAAATASGVRMRWDANVEPFVYGYDIERRTGSGSWDARPVGSTWRTDFVDTTAVSGTSYSYRLVAKSVTGATSPASAVSDPVRAGTDVAPRVDEVIDVAGSGGDRRVTFRWTPPTDPSLTGVGVERDDHDGRGYIWYGTFPVDDDHWVDTYRITNGSRYSYRFYALDATGFVLQAAEIREVVAGADTTAPATPATLAATAGDGEATLTWARNGEADIVRYDVRGRRCTLSAWIDWGSVSTARKLAKWLVDDTEYCFQVRAVDSSANTSGWTSSVRVTPDRATVKLGVVGGADFDDPAVTPLYAQLGRPSLRIELDAARDPAGTGPTAAVEAVTDEGVRPLILAGYYRTWPTRTEAATFCANAAAKYGPGGTAGLSDDVAVRYIEFGNESSFLYMGAGVYDRPEIYADRLHACVDAAAAANPFVGVLAIADDPNSRIWVSRIYAEMSDADEKLAGWTTHPYSPPTGSPGSIWAYSIDSAVAGTSGSTLPLIATEFGIASTSRGTDLTPDNFGWSTRMTWSGAATAATTVLNALKTNYPRLTEAYWYQVTDQAADNGVNRNREWFFGLFQTGGTTRKGDIFNLVKNTVDQGGWR